METYFKMKMFTEFILPFVCILIAPLVAVICVLTLTIKEHRIKKFFLSNGYKREIVGVSSYGLGVFYGWVRESDGKRVDDRDIEGWPLKRIKKKYE